MKVPGLNAGLLHDGTIILTIPAFAWLVQRLLDLTVVLDSWIDPPRGDMPPIHVKLEEEEVAGRVWLALDAVIDPELSTFQKCQ